MSNLAGKPRVLHSRKQTMQSPPVGFTLASLAHWWVCHALYSSFMQSQMGEYSKKSTLSCEISSRFSWPVGGVSGQTRPSCDH